MRHPSGQSKTENNAYGGDQIKFPSKAITPQLKFCPNLFSCVAVGLEGNYALSPYVLEWTERAVLENES